MLQYETNNLEINLTFQSNNPIYSVKETQYFHCFSKFLKYSKKKKIKLRNTFVKVKVKIFDKNSEIDNIKEHDNQ